MASVALSIGGGGVVRAIYADELAEVLGDLGGAPGIRRASHVEPRADGQWEADLGPVGGPVLGPFRFRRDALAAEVQWLERHAL